MERAKVVVEIFSRAAVILDEENRASWDFGIVIDEICHLYRIDGFESLFLQIVHHPAKVCGSDVVGGDVYLFPLDTVQHDHHDDGAGCGVVGIPLVVDVLAGILDVGVGWIERIQARGREGLWQSRWCADGSRWRDGCIRWNRSSRGLQRGEGCSIGLGISQAEIRGGGGCQRSAGSCGSNDQANDQK